MGREEQCMRAWTSRLGCAGRGWRAFPAIVLTAIVVACGGGYGGMSSNYTPPGATSGPASVSVGSITGFGSVHLNGKKFETTSTAIMVDGQASTQGDLHVGDVVEVKGHHDSSSGKDIADEIEMHSNVQGPVSAIDLTIQQLVVLGQTVVVSADTSFGDGISPAALAGIAVGDILRVSGMPSADGNIQATRVEHKPAGTAFRVTGTAASTDVNARTLQINALSVDFSAATLVDFPSSGPKDGDLVEASGTSLGAAGQLQATRLELRTGKELKGDANAESEIEGLVTRFVSASDFDVSGRPVTTSAATTFEGGTATDLALNVRVEAEGVVNSTAVLVATKVRIERSADTRIVAQADTVDATAGTVTVLGVQVRVTAMTRFEDHSSANVSTFSVADIHAGDWLEIRGSESPAGSNAVVASRLERRNAQGHVLLAGVVKTTTQPALTILSVAVATTPTTQFIDASGAAVTAEAFFAGLAGKVAAVLGTWDGTTLTASRVSLGGGEGEGEDN
jgi:hypothetical protein